MMTEGDIDKHVEAIENLLNMLPTNTPDLADAKASLVWFVKFQAASIKSYLGIEPIPVELFSGPEK